MVDDGSASVERLLGRAREDPDAVPVDPILTALDSAAVDDRRRALSALYEISKSTPERLLDVLPRLVEVLESDRPTFRSRAVLTMNKVGAVDPVPLLPHADAVRALLDDDSATVRRGAVRFLGHVAREDPTAVVSDVPRLVELLRSDHRETQRRVVDVLKDVATETPDAADLLVEPLLDVLADRHENTDDLDYRPGMAAEGGTANEQMRGHRTLAADEGERVTDTRVREGAAETLAALAADEPAALVSAVMPRLPRVFDLLDDRSPTVRGAAVGILAHVAERDPEAVRPAEPALLDLLDEPIAISGNAAWTLRYLGTERSYAALRELAEGDDAGAQLRALAERALADVEP